MENSLSICTGHLQINEGNRQWIVRWKKECIKVFTFTNWLCQQCCAPSRGPNEFFLQGNTVPRSKLKLRNSKGQKKTPWITVLFIWDISVFFFFSYPNLPDFWRLCCTLFTFCYKDIAIIVCKRYPENFVIKTKRSLKSCNWKYGYSMSSNFRPAPLE